MLYDLFMDEPNACHQDRDHRFKSWKGLGISGSAKLAALALLLAGCADPLSLDFRDRRGRGRGGSGGADGKEDAGPPRHVRDLTDPAEFADARRFVETEYGRIAVVENGKGPAAVFLHGFPLNAFHFRHQMTALADIRRCIGIDLMGLGHSDVPADGDLRFSVQAQMVLATLDALGVDEFDVVGNDSGGAIAQLVAVSAPDRIRSLVLTNSDVHDNWPPAALNTVHMLAEQRVLDDVLAGYLTDVEQSRNGLGALVYEDSQFITAELTAEYLAPVTANDVRREQLNRFLLDQDNAETVAIAGDLARLTAPTLVLWGTGDPFFDVEWAYWLRDTIPGTTQVIELPGAKLFFAEERPDEVNAHLRAHWSR